VTVSPFVLPLSAVSSPLMISKKLVRASGSLLTKAILSPLLTLKYVAEQDTSSLQAFFSNFSTLRILVPTSRSV